MNADAHPGKTKAEACLAEMFQSAKPTLPGGSGIARWRESAFADFCASGLPHRRIESWHYTDLRALMREALPLAASPAARALEAVRNRLDAITSPRIVLVDGYFAPALSSGLPEGVSVRPLGSVLAEGNPGILALLGLQDIPERDPVLSLNAALMQDGAVIEVTPRAAIAKPLHLIEVTAFPQPHARFSRSALIVGEGASLSLAQMHLRIGEDDSSPASQANDCLIISLDDGASLSQTAAAEGDFGQSLSIESVIVRAGAKAKYESFALVSGYGLFRRQLFLRFEAPGSEAVLSGVSLLRGREHADTSLRVEHAAPGCVSRETFKYILDGESTGVFQGRIHVAPGAQHTDAKMLSKAILLSDMATMNSKPELEIFADDVACGHGATCGGLDADQLFYLQSRGLPHAEAEALLLEAFAGELIDGLKNEEQVARLRRAVSAWLCARQRPEAAQGASSLRGTAQGANSGSSR
ncbi:MAG TPA: SufD family Fe-S cluster assembly protein [Methylocella sp.]|nr:SufD family Fe-S cluster assembly protein [Methylocella sp.]